MHPNKRDGGIMSCYVYDDKLQCGQDVIIKSCLEELCNVSGKWDYNTPIIEPMKLNISESQAKSLQWRLSSDKAVGFDGVYDGFLKECRNYRFLSSL